MVPDDVTHLADVAQPILLQVARLLLPEVDAGRMAADHQKEWSVLFSYGRKLQS